MTKEEIREKIAETEAVITDYLQRLEEIPKGAFDAFADKYTMAETRIKILRELFEKLP